VLLAYVDESGDSGYEGSRTYTLGCVFLPAAKWPGAFDNFISFRRFLHSRFGVKVRAEIKSNYLVGGRGRALVLAISSVVRSTANTSASQVRSI
jgi:hypothetical protein